MKLDSKTRRDLSPRNERGYIMLTLLLVMALMAIFAAVIVSSVTFDIKRDREEEMIHRGVQYSRAIRAYYKKFSRYPAKIEDLENTNQMRFLRKRYKDPLTGKTPPAPGHKTSCGSPRPREGRNRHPPLAAQARPTRGETQPPRPAG